MIALRAYAGPDDLGRMQALLRDLWRERGPHVPCLPADLVWRTHIYDDVAITLAHAEASGALTGFAMVLKGTLLDIVARDRATADALLATSTGATVYALTSDAALTDALRARDYQPAGDDYLTFSHALDVVPDADLAGYRITTLAETPDVAARAAVHRAAFGSERMTTERYAELVRDPAYDPRLDLVALAADGTMAAFVLGWYDAELRVGLCEPVGTHPAHRRRGLARALIVHALTQLHARGATSVSIGALADDPVTPRLYAELGFTLIDKNLGYRAGGTVG